MRIGRLPKGANTGFVDINTEPIREGDTIVDNDGLKWRVNSYCQAVPLGDDERKTAKLSELVKLKKVEVSIQMEEALNLPGNSGCMDNSVEEEKAMPLSWITDHELAAELRARGYEVTAVKITKIEL